MADLLLHVCCGPCALGALECLVGEGWTVRGFFYNPNIDSRVEHDRRLDAARRVFDARDLELVEGEYDAERWRATVGHLADEPEGGRRCALCFALRIDASCAEAATAGILRVATTLTVSPHKDALAVNAAGSSVARGRGATFLEYDFSEQNGYSRSVQLSREMGLYRQNYCGCTWARVREV